jgi:dihydroneopterin aldolase
MKKPSKLLETVASRIIKSIFKQCGIVSWAYVSVAKINPPLGGDVEKVVVSLEKNRG